MNRILVDATEVSPEGTLVLVGERARHLRDVLGAVPGQSVRLGILDGRRGTGTVLSMAADGVRLRVTLEGGAPPVPAVDLVLALPRPKVLKRLWSQLAALGVHRVLLANAERVERPYWDTQWVRPEHHRPLLVEGLQQAGDTRLPVVTLHRSFRRLVEDELDVACPCRLRLVAHPGAGEPLVRVPLAGGRAVLAVGPEGGWNTFELDLLTAHGFVVVNAGNRVLRSDTACIALLATLHQRLDVA